MSPDDGSFSQEYFFSAGGYAGGDTLAQLHAQGLSADAVPLNNDACHALQKTGGLSMTG